MNHPERAQGSFQRFHDCGALRIVSWTLIGICLAALFALVFGLAVKALWNWIMPAVFGLGVITYWQAFGIVILTKILFSGIGPHSAHDKHGSPFQRHRSTTDRWWREEGKSAYDNWLKGQAAAKPADADVNK